MFALYIALVSRVKETSRAPRPRHAEVVCVFFGNLVSSSSGRYKFLLSAALYRQMQSVNALRASYQILNAHTFGQALIAANLLLPARR